jgi:hypothetical protein
MRHRCGKEKVDHSMTLVQVTCLGIFIPEDTLDSFHANIVEEGLLQVVHACDFYQYNILLHFIRPDVSGENRSYQTRLVTCYLS